MDELERLRSNLAIQKSEAQQEMKALWMKVEALWDRLETDETQKEKVRTNCGGIKPAHLLGLKQVCCEKFR